MNTRSRRREIPDLNYEMIAPVLRSVHSCLELGCKRAPKRAPYKAFFERHGIRHVSVDINGEHGSLALDLRRPLNLGTFDLVTNYGTTEHVSVQEPAWRNIVEATHVGSWVVSTCPTPGTWPNHGLWYPTDEFYVELANLNGFGIDCIYRQERGPTKTQTAVRMKRLRHTEFVMPSESLLFHNATRDKYSDRIPEWTDS